MGGTAFEKETGVYHESGLVIKSSGITCDAEENTFPGSPSMEDASNHLPLYKLT
ncbi:hypothetical protein CEXT_261061, partial [Caerostris extrusa]